MINLVLLHKSIKISFVDRQLSRLYTTICLSQFNLLLLQADVLLTHTSNCVYHLYYISLSTALHIQALTHVYYKVFNNGNLGKLELIVIVCFRQYTYFMVMSQYSVVLALYNAQFGVGASPYRKLLSNWYGNNMHKTVCLFTDSYAQLQNNLVWLMMLH